MAVPLPTPGLGKNSKSRRWLISLGVFSILMGIFAIAFPFAASVAIAQVIGILLVLSGVFSIGAVFFGEEKNHRIATIVLALIRLMVGLLLIAQIQSGVLALTALLGAFFFVEGVIFAISAFTLRHNRAWPLMLLNGLITVLLGGLIFAEYPSSAAWAIGLLYGIYSVFYGMALLAFAAAIRRPS